MRHFFNRLFATNRSEVRGFLTLIVLISVLSAMVYGVDHLSKPRYSELQEESNELDSILTLIERDYSTKTEIDSVEVKRFYFNPNTLDIAGFSALGLDTLIARRIIKYRSKGGVFRIKSDFARIYGLSRTTYEGLMPYITLPDQLKNKAEIKPAMKPARENSGFKKAATQEADPLPHFDLNKADTSILQTVRGIGSILSKRIVAFRSALGGFVNSTQVYAVYNLDSATAQSLLSQSFIEKGFVPARLNINSVTVDVLAGHPYISRQQARLIVSYRNQHGSFDGPAALSEVYAIDDLFIKKIAPYLNFSE